MWHELRAGARQARRLHIQWPGHGLGGTDALLLADGLGCRGLTRVCTSGGAAKGQ